MIRRKGLRICQRLGATCRGYPRLSFHSSRQVWSFYQSQNSSMQYLTTYMMSAGSWRRRRTFLWSAGPEPYCHLCAFHTGGCQHICVSSRCSSDWTCKASESWCHGIICEAIECESRAIGAPWRRLSCCKLFGQASTWWDSPFMFRRQLGARISWTNKSTRRL